MQQRKKGIPGRQMERLLEHYDKECMKMAILKHEETFRQQVHELHRLYRVQKILMNDLKNAEPRRWRVENETASPQLHFGYSRNQSRPQRPLDLQLPAEKYIVEDDAEEDEESELELTLAIGRKMKKNKKKKEESLTSDSAASFSSSSVESNGVKLNGNQWRQLQSQRMNVFNVEDQMRQGRLKHPPWLLQCLSLNMTS